MQFQSYEFILIFLPVVILLYFASCRICTKLGKLVLILESVLFLALNSFEAIFVFALSLFMNYAFNISVKRNTIWRRKILIGGVLANFVLLLLFKIAVKTSFDILFPVGLSFYTFQQIAFLVDNYKGEVEPYSFMDFVLFNSFFPKLLQGPIVYHNELIYQFNDEGKRKFCYENFNRGVVLLAIGLAKKNLIANNLSLIVEYGYSHIPALNSFETILCILSYTLELYMDFSGYCDIAMGVSSMLNIELPINFNSPYKALNISDFWKRWHITLTRFLTKYIYYPLGGNRMGKSRTYINIIIVFIVSGIWHGIGWTFIIWGALQAIATIVYKETKNCYDRIPQIVQWLITFIFINVSWVFFRAQNLSSACSMLRQVFVGRLAFSINSELTESLLMPTIINIPSYFVPLVVVVSAAIVAMIVVCRSLSNSNEIAVRFKPNWFSLVMVYLLMIISIVSMAGVGSFLYINF